MLHQERRLSQSSSAPSLDGRDDHALDADWSFSNTAASTFAAAGC
jgi:hypothetical protein